MLSGSNFHGTAVPSAPGRGVSCERHCLRKLEDGAMQQKVEERDSSRIAHCNTRREEKGTLFPDRLAEMYEVCVSGHS